MLVDRRPGLLIPSQPKASMRLVLAELAPACELVRERDHLQLPDSRVLYYVPNHGRSKIMM